MTEKQINHVLVPKHEKISEAEKKELFEKYKISVKELPRISKTDVAIMHLDVKIGDVIKITRKSPTAELAIYYRGVSNE